MKKIILAIAALVLVSAFSVAGQPSQEICGNK
jgi:hypothetical protein